MAVATSSGRFEIAFDDDAFTWAPDWTRIDSHPSLVTSYTVDRGRQYELDQTDTGRASVQVSDHLGLLDPTNPSGPYYGKIEPLLQAMLGVYDPVALVWRTRFRGWIEDFDYDFDPSQKVNRLTVTLVDIFERLSAMEMQPGQIGQPPPTPGNVWWQAADMKTRIEDILGPTHGIDLAADWSVIFTGNVNVQNTTYSPGETVLSAIQDAANAEFPGVSNVYVDRHGRLCVHGREAKFDPAGVAGPAGGEAWTFNHWNVGDQAAVDAGAALTPTPKSVARVREFAYNRGLSKIINQASATPFGIADDDVAGQLVKDDASILKYGLRSWSAENLITLSGKDATPVPVGDALTETKKFAQYYVDNYKAPQPRVTRIAFRPLPLDALGVGHTWALMSAVDISDLVSIDIQSPGGGHFVGDFYVEGIHDQVGPLNDTMDDMTVSLDLSPSAQGYEPIPST